mmetsp:Transcript_1866/g.3046  ORF Transcript_1866/g.3046 Transcript_1866/m.3046 type:complete len:85 (-) Transcript_1866:374-628(-)
MRFQCLDLLGKEDIVQNNKSASVSGTSAIRALPARDDRDLLQFSIEFAVRIALESRLAARHRVLQKMFFFPSFPDREISGVTQQ